MHDEDSTPTQRPRAAPLGSLALAGLLALGAMAALPLASLAQDDGQVTVSTATDDLGTYLVGPDGRTLYYFTRDVTPGAERLHGRLPGSLAAAARSRTGRPSSQARA